MNLLLDVIVKNGLLLDAAGVLGLGLLGLAAVQMAKRDPSWNGTIMAAGAVSLLLARLYFIAAPHFITNDVLAAIGPLGITATIAVPPLLLIFGLGGIVWGFWGHDRWLTVKAR